MRTLAWLGLALAAGAAETALLGSFLQDPGIWREDVFLWPRLLGPLLALRWPTSGRALVVLGSLTPLLVFGLCWPLLLLGIPIALEMMAGMMIQLWAVGRLDDSPA
jgi:hypothetical protein